MAKRTKLPALFYYDWANVARVPRVLWQCVVLGISFVERLVVHFVCVCGGVVCQGVFRPLGWVLVFGLGRDNLSFGVLWIVIRSLCGLLLGVLLAFCLKPYSDFSGL